MTPFHVGMRVVCVDDNFLSHGTRGEITPSNGGIYTIREITPRYAFRLVEIVNKPLEYKQGFGECSFQPRRFRPAHENRMDELRTLLAPVPSKELVQS